VQKFNNRSPSFSTSYAFLWRAYTAKFRSQSYGYSLRDDAGVTKRKRGKGKGEDRDGTWTLPRISVLEGRGLYPCSAPLHPEGKGLFPLLPFPLLLAVIHYAARLSFQSNPSKGEGWVSLLRVPFCLFPLTS